MLKPRLPKMAIGYGRQLALTINKSYRIKRAEISMTSAFLMASFLTFNPDECKL